MINSKDFKNTASGAEALINRNNRLAFWHKFKENALIAAAVFGCTTVLIFCTILIIIQRFGK